MNLDKVYKGTYKNLTKPVPVDDLWDMWQRKMPYLLKVYDRNKRMGKTIEAGQQHLLVCCTNFALKSLKIQLFKVQTI